MIKSFPPPVSLLTPFQCTGILLPTLPAICFLEEASSLKQSTIIHTAAASSLGRMLIRISKVFNIFDSVQKKMEVEMEMEMEMEMEKANPSNQYQNFNYSIRTSRSRLSVLFEKKSRQRYVGKKERVIFSI